MRRNWLVFLFFFFASSLSVCVSVVFARRLFVGGSSPVDAVAAGLNHATTGAAGKAINGLKVAYSQSGLTGKVSSTLVTTHQPPSSNQMVTGEIYHSDTDVPPKKVSNTSMNGLNELRRKKKNLIHLISKLSATRRVGWAARHVTVYI